ncbi:MAG TPA: ferrochelatase [Actinomycetota bacterium]
MSEAPGWAGSTIGVLVMAYGSAAGPYDVERYYTDIRGGRRPSPEHLEDLKARYAAIGNRFPLLETTRRQAEGLERELNAATAGPRYRVYLGMKHSPPFIADAVEEMRSDGIDLGIGLVLAPHWSGMSVETYIERVETALADGGPEFMYVRQWYWHPRFVEFLASRVFDALEKLPRGDRDKAAVIFSAHSLPTRALPDGTLRCKACDRCPERCQYVAQLQRTADLVAAKLGLEDYLIAWQSAGRTNDPWWGPSVVEMIRDLAATGHRAVVVCPAGFVSDHLETLYDLDIEARRTAEEAGIRFERTEMPNDDPAFIGALSALIRQHLSYEPASSS